MKKLKFLPDFKEREYISKLPFQTTKHGNGYNLRCPICGDSKVKESKKRGWILTDRSPFVYYCFNCGTSISFQSFLKKTSPILFEEYQKDLDKIFFRPKPASVKIQTVKESNIDLNFSKLSLKVFAPIKESQIHIDYCQERKIPQSVIDRLYYIKNPNLISSNNFLTSSFLIFPFYYKNTDYVYGFQGRNITKKEFYTHLFPNFPKIYNMYGVDYSKPVFVLESIIDTLFIPNSIAMLGADLKESFIKKYPKDTFVFLFDNDETGKLKSQKYLNKNLSVVLYPKNFPYKDINEMVVKDPKMFLDFRDNINSYVSKGNLGLAKMKIQNYRRSSVWQVL